MKVKISSLNQLEFKKIIFKNQNIKISPSHLRKIFAFFTHQKKGQVIFKNSNLLLKKPLIFVSILKLS